MKKLMMSLAVAMMCVTAALAQSGEKISSIFSVKMESLEGETIPLDSFRGKVILIVNTASKCGFTPQYAGLQKLYDKYKDQGLVILGFPCNQFFGQEPGTAKEIRSTCLRNYGVTFPMFAKIDVNGKDEAPLYTYLKEKAPFAGYSDKKTGEMLDNIHKKNKTGYDEGNNIRWNFTKFLISKDEKTIKRYEPMVKPEEMEKDIETMLSE
jgi:glutathione peroxidase